MSIDRILFFYMVAVGIIVGAVLVAVPAARNFSLPPYFWILIAVGVFDAAAYLHGRGAPGTMASMNARMLSFLVSLLLMAGVPLLFGVELPRLL